MQTYELLVQGRAVRANSADTTLVRTSIGIDKVHVMFDDSEWLAFPLKVTFAQGETKVTQSLLVNELDGGEWVAEAECVIPWECIQMVGAIRVTFQGTDADGNHIITAAGSPLSVEEAGDVEDGSVPESAPSMDEWNQAYAKAVEAANQAASLVANLKQQLAAMVEGAESDVAGIVQDYSNPATSEDLGLVMVGDGLAITEDGVLSTLATNGITDDESYALANLRLLAEAAFDSEFDDEGILEGAVLKKDALPIDAVPNVVVAGSGLSYEDEEGDSGIIRKIRHDDCLGSTKDAGFGVLSEFALGSGTTFPLPYLSFDAQGHARTAGSTRVSMPVFPSMRTVYDSDKKQYSLVPNPFSQIGTWGFSDIVAGPGYVYSPLSFKGYDQWNQLMGGTNERLHLPQTGAGLGSSVSGSTPVVFVDEDWVLNLLAVALGGDAEGYAAAVSEWRGKAKHIATFTAGSGEGDPFTIETERDGALVLPNKGPLSKKAVVTIYSDGAILSGTHITTDGVRFVNGVYTAQAEFNYWRDEEGGRHDVGSVMRNLVPSEAELDVEATFTADWRPFDRVQLPSITKSGCELAGYSTSEEASTADVFDYYTPTGDVTLYAVWKEQG